jgi:hypothetical protein
MAKYYTVEKAKYGGVTGTIQPFTLKLDDVNIPTEALWQRYVPAGFLRCDGSIYSASLFPGLAEIIGTGQNCKFARDVSKLTDTQFQLPDLGSKYVRCSNSTGAYLNTTLEQDPTVSKVGAETVVESLIGDTATIRYSGYFEVLGDIEDFGGNPLYRTSTGNTLNASLSEDAFQAHGHNADVGVLTYLGKWTDSNFVEFAGGGRGGNDAQTEGSNNLVTIDAPEGASYNVNHTHQITLPSSTTLKGNTTFKYQYFNTQISADGLESEINITTENVQKLDSAISPYILVEYIIKI